MIPKIIHYCWFGGNPIPDDVKICIESWKKYCPDYEIKEWNERNFDVNCCDYVKEAYQAKKWAFVSDYARFEILNKNGGLYFDTDVEIIKDISHIIDNGNFMACENEKMTIATGLGFGLEPNNAIAQEIINDYKKSQFFKANGSYDLMTVCERVTNILKKYGLTKSKYVQKICDIRIYPKDYFCPLNYTTGALEITENTVCIHHFHGSWFSDEEREAERLKRKFTKIFNHRISIYAAQFIVWCKYRGVVNTIKMLISQKGK